MTHLHQEYKFGDADWVMLYTSNKGYEIEILKSVLEDEEIPAIIINKQDSAYIVIGDIELYVKREDLLSATQILNRFNEQK